MGGDPRDVVGAEVQTSEAEISDEVQAPAEDTEDAEASDESGDDESAAKVLDVALELRRRGGGVGAAALCGGGGQGDALILHGVASARLTARGYGGGEPLRPGRTLPESQTRPALDLSALYNGFAPLLSALDDWIAETGEPREEPVLVGQRPDDAVRLHERGRRAVERSAQPLPVARQAGAELGEDEPDALLLRQPHDGVQQVDADRRRRLLLATRTNVVNVDVAVRCEFPIACRNFDGFCRRAQAQRAQHRGKCVCC